MKASTRTQKKRQMKARQEANNPGEAQRAMSRQIERLPLSRERSEPKYGEGEDDDDGLAEDVIEPGLIVDQGDGTRFIRRARRTAADDQESHECPDVPPKGWCEG